MLLVLLRVTKAVTAVAALALSPVVPPLGAATASQLASAQRYTVERTSRPISVDGQLDDPGWQGAEPIPIAYEWFPGDNVAPPVRTDAFVTFDDSHLYVAWRCFDPEPQRIRAHLMDRDDTGTLIQDDHVLVTVDTFNDERRGYQFRVNPLGVQADALFSEAGGVEDFSFDMIWRSAGRIDARGYVVEVAIPFKQLRFPRSKEPQTWGFDLQRSYPRIVRHRIAASAFDRNNNCLMCQYVKVDGIEGGQQGRNLEVSPTMTALRTDIRDDFPRGDLRAGDEDTEAGLKRTLGTDPPT